MSQAILDILNQYPGFPSGTVYAVVSKHTPKTLEKLAQLHKTMGDSAEFTDMVDGMVAEAFRISHVRIDAPDIPFNLTEAGRKHHKEYIESLDRLNQRQYELFWEGGGFHHDYAADKKAYLEARERSIREWIQGTAEYYRSNDVTIPEKILGFAKEHSVELP